MAEYNTVWSDGSINTDDADGMSDIAASVTAALTDNVNVVDEMNENVSLALDNLGNVVERLVSVVENGAGVSGVGSVSGAYDAGVSSDTVESRVSNGGASENDVRERMRTRSEVDSRENQASVNNSGSFVEGAQAIYSAMTGARSMGTDPVTSRLNDLTNIVSGFFGDGTGAGGTFANLLNTGVGQLITKIAPIAAGVTLTYTAIDKLTDTIYSGQQTSLQQYGTKDAAAGWVATVGANLTDQIEGLVTGIGDRTLETVRKTLISGGADYGSEDYVAGYEFATSANLNYGVDAGTWAKRWVDYVYKQSESQDEMTEKTAELTAMIQSMNDTVRVSNVNMEQLDKDITSAISALSKSEGSEAAAMEAESEIQKYYVNEATESANIGGVSAIANAGSSWATSKLGAAAYSQALQESGGDAGVAYAEVIRGTLLEGEYYNTDKNFYALWNEVAIDEKGDTFAGLVRAGDWEGLRNALDSGYSSDIWVGLGTNPRAWLFKTLSGLGFTSVDTDSAIVALRSLVGYTENAENSITSNSGDYGVTSAKTLEEIYGTESIENDMQEFVNTSTDVRLSAAYSAYGDSEKQSAAALLQSGENIDVNAGIKALDTMGIVSQAEFSELTGMNDEESRQKFFDRIMQSYEDSGAKSMAAYYSSARGKEALNEILNDYGGDETIEGGELSQEQEDWKNVISEAIQDALPGLKDFSPVTKTITASTLDIATELFNWIGDMDNATALDKGSEN